MIQSTSPYGDEFSYQPDDSAEREAIDRFLDKNRPTVGVQGLGFVGAAMVAALTNAKSATGKPTYNVIGVDLPNPEHYWKIARVNAGRPPIVSKDPQIDLAYEKGRRAGNLFATYSDYAYQVADIVVIDIHLDIRKIARGKLDQYELIDRPFLQSMKVLAEKVREGTLVLLETTVPPGTTEKLVYPVFKEAFRRRGLDIQKLYLAHSYERVMPGKKYLDSIVNFCRVFSGVNEPSRKKAREFLESFIHTKEFPLSELRSTTASELSKVLENSFRAANIALMQEWTEFADRAGVDLFEVLDAIRVRPTHKNIMSPGFGVGGYCLTKDSLLADWSNRTLFGSSNSLRLSLEAVLINDEMPSYTFQMLKQKLGDLKGKSICILGVSYLNDIADTRYSPAQVFYEKCWDAGAEIRLHDPLVSYWPELDLKVATQFDALKMQKHEVAVFTVRHQEYLGMSAASIRENLPGIKLVMDANNVLSEETATGLRESGVEVIGIGKGHWRE